MTWSTFAKGVVGGLVALYIVACVAARVTHRRLLYPARAEALSVPRGAEVVDTVAADGVAGRALYFPAPADAPTVVWFHGNAATMSDGAAKGGSCGLLSR